MGSFGWEVAVVGMSVDMLRVEMEAMEGCGGRGGGVRRCGGFEDVTKDGEPGSVGHC
jgi:hypothetical protein